jgi:hypothetical protein
MTTPCEKLGYKVGDKFRCLSGHVGFEIGQIIALYRDDGSYSPLFFGKNSEYTNCDGKPGAHLNLDYVEKINQEVNMNKTITLTEEQYAALQSGESITIVPPKPKIAPWEPKGGDWYVKISGDVGAGMSTAPCRLFGNEFQTETEAIADAIALRARNRLAAYVREFAPEWKADWSDSNQKKWFVYFDFRGSEWGISYNIHNKSACEVYMPEHVARELAKKLNSGEVVL